MDGKQDPKATEVALDVNEQIAERKAKLGELRKQGQAYPNDFKREHLASELHQQYESFDGDDLKEAKHPAKVAGRIMMRRVMGKASFIHLQDMSGRIQIYLRRDDLPEGVYESFKHWDLGDIIGIEGYMFKTKTGELSVHASEIRILTKALRPLPDKYHGLLDREARYRQRYLDLIVNDDSRKLFAMRTDIIEYIRQFLKARQFQEVETPMMQVLPGGAAARPFITHHNALDMELFLRVAPELYLKRLVVGGVERVFEINRNFRNEGLSVRHNPEFTMLEFYQAYADYNDLMDLTEEMLRGLAQSVVGSTSLSYEGHIIDFLKPFRRVGLRESILEFNQEITEEQIDDEKQARKIAKRLNISLKESDGLGKVQLEIFEKTVEHLLLAPTFITAYPAEVSPLARRNDENPFLTDRFEFFVGGRELANGFSELNDPEDQAERFKKQVEDREQHGDLEAMPYDEDYITALEYGMPPTAGEGIGIDRLVMLLTDSAAIRDVILFPHMKKK